MKYDKYKESALERNAETKKEYDNLKFKPETMIIKPLNNDSNSFMFVPVDEMFCEMMNWAVRYALGRKTYAVKDTVEYIIRVLNFLDDKTIHVMLRDIVEHEKYNDLGDECDAENWMKLKGLIKNKLGIKEIFGES